MKKKMFILLFLSFFAFMGVADARLKCEYGTNATFKFTCTITEGILNCTVSGNNSQITASASNNLIFSDFVNDEVYFCPKKIYCTVDAYGQHVTFKDWTMVESGTSVNLLSSEGEGETVDFKQINAAYCPLGPDVTQDLYGALKIFKIVAPILCLVFSVIEVVKAVANGDIDSESKKIYKRFLKRMLYTVILFFLPVLVDSVMQMINVWDETGHCNILDLNNRDLENSEASKCYFCSDTGIYYWGSYKDIKPKCASLRLEDSLKNSTTCREKSARCYKCGDGSYHWYTYYQAHNTEKCPEPYVKYDISKAECDLFHVKACYQCAGNKSAPDAKLMAWDTYGNFRGNCENANAFKNNLSESECHE